MAYILRITDGDWITNLTNDESGWILLSSGWQPQTASFKGGGYYSNAMMAHGAQLRHAVFDNVVEALQLKLDFYQGETDLMTNQIDMLEELGMVRAPRYWTDRRCHAPVWLERQLDGETGIAYCLVNQAKLTLPQDAWDSCTHQTGILEPCLLVIDRQPFWMGAQPGTAQADVEVSAEQAWDYNLLWGEESALPSGNIYCMVEDHYGNIWAGGDSEILKWNGSAWAAVNTAPEAIAGSIFGIAVLTNDDILFADTGQILKLSGGAWSVETSDPGGQVTALLEAYTGEVFAAENSQIRKRDTDGTWAVDTTLPVSWVYSLLQASSGKVLAGGTGEILRQTDPPVSVSFTALLSNDEEDNGEQFNTSCYVPPRMQDMDLFDYNWVAVRFALDIPAGAQVNSCVLRCMLRGSDASGTSLPAKIYCEDADDASALANSLNNISGRTLTTAYTAWQDTEKRRRDRWFYSPDFANALQEVVDRGGWESGNNVLVVVKCDDTTFNGDHPNRRQIWDYTGCKDQAPALEITYTTGSAESWEVVSTLPAGNVRCFLEVSGNDLILAGENSQILGSDDGGDTWGVLDTTPSDECRALYEDSDGIIWAGDNGNILKSADAGRSFAVDSTLPSGYCRAIVEETATGDLRAGDDGGTRILILDFSDRVTLGVADTTENIAFVANKHNQANVTHVKIDDGGAFTDIFPIAAYPQDLLPDVPAVNDALYIGVDTSLADTGPFCSAIFDIATPATDVTITWEYYNGATWATLTTTDETSDLSHPGVKAVVWKQPSNWGTVAVDGDTAYWIRARVSAVGASPDQPTQQNRDIYSVVWPCVEIDYDQCQGNIDSLVQIRLHNRGDTGGPGGSEPLLYANRVLGGVKKTEDHTNFRAFLNFADEQNVSGITVDVTVDPDSATSIEADSNLSSATGKRVFFDAGAADGGNGLNNWEDRVSIDLGPTVARDYYGTYKVFLRCKQNGGSAGEVNLRIKTVGGSGGVSALTEPQETQSTTDHELIEFDTPITLPVSTQMTPDELGDETAIVVQISAEQNDADLYLYDMFLLPVDEIWFDATDKANSAESSVENGRRLLVDSVTIPKSPTRGIVQKIEAGTNVSTWVLDGDGKARLPAGDQVRLWFLAARTSTTGTSFTWLSEPEMLFSVKVAKVDRWLLGRGES